MSLGGEVPSAKMLVHSKMQAGFRALGESLPDFVNKTSLSELATVCQLDSRSNSGLAPHLEEGFQ
jgi:hypothetical protein